MKHELTKYPKTTLDSTGYGNDDSTTATQALLSLIYPHSPRSRRILMSELVRARP